MNEYKPRRLVSKEQPLDPRYWHLRGYHVTGEQMGEDHDWYVLELYPGIRELEIIGFIRRLDDGTIRWPVRVCSRQFWRYCFRHERWFGVFRNLPGFIKWDSGRLLPRRWGVRILGFEFGDRG